MDHYSEPGEEERHIVYVERIGMVKYTYYDDGVVKITRYKARKKIYWGRVIAALVVSVLLIMGIVQLIGAAAKAVSSSKQDIGRNTSMPESSKAAVSDKDSGSKTADKTSKAEDPGVVPDYNDINVRVCLDPGHGDYDTGTVAGDGIVEAEQNLEFALLVRDYLQSCGASVTMTRESDTSVSLSDRCDIANRAGSDFFVSLHRNSTSDPEEHKGVEVWVNNKQPKYDTELAQNILNELESVGISKNLGIKYGYSGIPDNNYQVNQDTIMPSCMLELGFVTNDEDNELYDKNKEKYAKAVGDGIIMTAISLGVVNSDGSRKLNEQLISDGKSNVKTFGSTDSGDSSSEAESQPGENTYTGGYGTDDGYSTDYGYSYY